MLKEITKERYEDILFDSNLSVKQIRDEKYKKNETLETLIVNKRIKAYRHINSESTKYHEIKEG